MVQTNGTSLYVRVGGSGPAVVLLHGFGDTGDMWAPLAKALVRDHTVIVPDLRGMGLSAHPPTGYTKKNQALDIAGVMDSLHVQKADLVTHDIGNMVGYALAAQYPTRITRWAVIDAPLPGIGNWDQILCSPLLWHFNFRGPDEERLVQGRERIYLDRFYNELSADPKRVDEQTRQHYAKLCMHGSRAMHDAFEQFGAFSQDAVDNKDLLAKVGKLSRCRCSPSGPRNPLAAGWPTSCASLPPTSRWGSFLTRVTGSWRKTRRPPSNSSRSFLPDEIADDPRARIARGRCPGRGGRRLFARSRLAQSVDAMQAHDAGPNSGGRNPRPSSPVTPQSGSYTIRLSIPAHTRIRRTLIAMTALVVVAGTWYFGYGTTAKRESAAAGAFTEPEACRICGDQETPVVLYITGSGPDTVYVRQER